MVCPQSTRILGAAPWVPADSGVDELVLASRSVQHYVTLNARVGGLYGSPSLWDDSNWKAVRLESVNRWMVTRHDVWISGREDNIQTIQHGEAWDHQSVR